MPRRRQPETPPPTLTQEQADRIYELVGPILDEFYALSAENAELDMLRWDLTQATAGQQRLPIITRLSEWISVQFGPATTGERTRRFIRGWTIPQVAVHAEVTPEEAEILIEELGRAQRLVAGINHVLNPDWAPSLDEIDAVAEAMAGRANPPAIADESAEPAPERGATRSQWERLS